MNLRDLKQEIIKITPEEYRVKTNFSSNDFFVEIGNFIICAKTICTESEVKYEFVLDTQFISSKELTIVSFILFITKMKNKTRLQMNVYNAGVATLTVGSIIKGVLDIL